MKGEYKTKSRNAIVEYLKENADKRFTARDIIEALDGDRCNQVVFIGKGYEKAEIVKLLYDCIEKDA